MLILEYIAPTLIKVGFTLKLPKCQFMKDTLKYLGIELKVSTNYHSIPEDKLSVFCQWTIPESQGALNSKLSSLSFFYKYLPFYKIVCYPLLVLAKAENLNWTQSHMQCCNELMLLFEMTLKLKLINSNSRLALFTDASNISSGVILVEIDPKTLDFHTILADFRIFTHSERTSSIFNKEIPT